jgi:predicted metal-dependent hydrolase
VQRELSYGIGDLVQLSSGALPLQVVRSSRARRYLLRLTSDRAVRLTIPRGGSLAHGHEFLERNMSWLESAAKRLALRPTVPREWRVGTEIIWRGETARIEVAQDQPSTAITFAGEFVLTGQTTRDLRPQIERHIQKLAAQLLPPLVFAFARRHSLDHAVQRVTIRNQRSRWGSCSRRGTISLNWRILQAPTFVRDYLIVHELMHLREMNHSRRFWAHVADVCPEYKAAERWLNQHSYLLRP